MKTLIDIVLFQPSGEGSISAYGGGNGLLVCGIPSGTLNKLEHSDAWKIVGVTHNPMFLSDIEANSTKGLRWVDSVQRTAVIPKYELVQGDVLTLGDQ